MVVPTRWVTSSNKYVTTATVIEVFGGGKRVIETRATEAASGISHYTTAHFEIEWKGLGREASS